MALIDTVRAERLAKIERLKESGFEAYPSTNGRTHTVQQFLENHTVLEQDFEQVVLAGRVMSLREHGGALFVDIFDGTKGQCFLQKDKLGDDIYGLFVATVDTGDIIEFSGTAFTTKRGMPSLSVSSWRMLAKSLRPLPDEWFGIKDEDERYRKRYLDILLTGELAERIKRRSLFWNTIRQFLLDRDFIEVETPALENITGGAYARPFVTHHNALDMDVYLRISAGELWQKRLLIAGLPKIFEIGRIFRNEGMSAEHLQDYTQVEFYEAFKDYEAGMEMITDLYRDISDKVYGKRTFTIKGSTIDLDKEWETYDYSDLMEKEFGVNPLDVKADWALVLKEKNIQFEKEAGIERLVDIAWKQIRKSLAGPGFLINVPAYMEPLAKKSAKDPRVVERFQVIIAGSEIGKGFSELNDPVDQAARFKRQQQLREAGDEEAQMADTEFVEALEYGMPPAFGFGVSERLFSFLEGVSVREAQIFPLMRPRDNEIGKAKENKDAVAVINRTGLESWQVLNTIAHLCAELGIREGKSLLYQDSFATADGTHIPLNIQHPIMLKETDSTEKLRKLLQTAQAQGLQVAAFTRDMIETTNDKKIIENAAKTNLDSVEFLGILVLGPSSTIESLTKE